MRAEAAGQAPLPAPAGLERVDGTLSCLSQPGGEWNPQGFVRTLDSKEGPPGSFQTTGRATGGSEWPSWCFRASRASSPGQLSPVIRVGWSHGSSCVSLQLQSACKSYLLLYPNLFSIDVTSFSNCPFAAWGL